ncbi:MAG: hypothetical protein CMP50_05475 [Flavobacteriales bacterium]|nr:hypothetical protein [Flavobacteriales bacterium]
MIPFGTLFNVLTVLLGSIIGLRFKKIINPDLNKKVFFVLGLFTLVLGFSMAVKSSNFILMFLSVVFGTILGEYFNLDCSIKKFTDTWKHIFKLKDHQFTDGLLTGFLLFCVGSMTIVGAIDEGLGKPPDILYTKSIMDGISSIILASTLGIGVLFSVFPMLLFQGGITLAVFYYKDFLPMDLVQHISCLGGVLIIAIGLKILGYEKINPINILPSLIVIVLLYLLESSFKSLLFS